MYAKAIACSLVGDQLPLVIIPIFSLPFSTAHAFINNEVQILIRGKKFKGVITKRAFYKKNY
jgi:hypothetical protein